MPELLGPCAKSAGSMSPWEGADLLVSALGVGALPSVGPGGAAPFVEAGAMPAAFEKLFDLSPVTAFSRVRLTVLRELFPCLSKKPSMLDNTCSFKNEVPTMT